MGEGILVGLKRPALAKSTTMATIGTLPDVTLRGQNAPTVLGAELQGWRRRFVDVAPSVSPTFGAFQVVAVPTVGDAIALAAVAPLKIPHLSWTYIRGAHHRSPFLAAIPPTEPRAVIARATAYMIRWAGLSAEQRTDALRIADDRLLEAFSREVDPSMLNRAERLLILSTIYVHPAARGQQLGIRLLWSVIAAMGFTSADAIVADPWPIGTPWSQADTPFTPVGEAAVTRAFEGIHALCKYYEPLGLRFMPPRSAFMPALVLSTSCVPGL